MNPLCYRNQTNAAVHVLAVACCVLSSTPVLAGSIVQYKGHATLEIQFDAEQPRIALSDTITLTLTIEGSDGLKVAPPRRFGSAAKWILDETSTPEVTAVGPGRKRWRETYRFAPREPGTIPFVFPPVSMRDGGADAETVAFDPVEFTVTTQITEPDRADLRDRIDIETDGTAPPDEDADAAWWWLAAAVPLIGVAIFLVRRWLRRRRPRSPRDRALYEWRRLVALKLPESGRQERFVTLLTLVLREYLERDLNLPVRKQTTSEFLRGATEHPSFTEAEKRFLAEFLRRADAVKFAHVEMPAEECRAWAEQLRHFLHQRDRNQRAKTGQARKNSPVEESGQAG